MIEATRGAGQFGHLYWCIKTGLSPDGAIHVLADRLEVMPCGALVAWGAYRAHPDDPPGPPQVNLVCAAGQWAAAYAASPVDGGGLAIQNWPGEVAHGRNRAANTEHGRGLHEVPAAPRRGEGRARCPP